MFFDHSEEGPILEEGEPHSDETVIQMLRGPNKESVSFNTKKIKEENQRSIKKTSETVALSLDTLELCASKYCIERSQGQCKN